MFQEGEAFLLAKTGLSHSPSPKKKASKRLLGTVYKDKAPSCDKVRSVAVATYSWGRQLAAGAR